MNGKFFVVVFLGFLCLVSSGVSLPSETINQTVISSEKSIIYSIDGTSLNVSVKQEYDLAGQLLLSLYDQAQDQTPLVEHHGKNIKFTYLLFIPDSITGDLVAQSLEYITFRVDSDQPLERTIFGVRYLKSTREEPLMVTNEYVEVDFSDVTQFLQYPVQFFDPFQQKTVIMNVSAPHTVILEGNTVFVRFDVRQMSFLRNSFIVLDPTISINNVQNYSSIKNNVTCEEHPLCHITINDTGLQFYLPFDANFTKLTGANTSYDYTSTNINVNAQDGAYWNDSGYIGGSAQFDGIDDKIIGTTTELVSNTSIAVSAWVYLTDGGANYKYIAVRGGTIFSPFASWVLYKNAACPFTGITGLSFGVGTGPLGGGLLDSACSADLPVNRWVHVLGTWDGTNIFFYTNGTLTQTISHVGNMTVVNNDLNIGWSPDFSVYWPGQIDELMVFMRNVSQAEVTALYQSKLPRYAGPPALQRFENLSIGQNGSFNALNVTTNATILNNSNLSLMILEYNGVGANTANSTLRYIASGENQVLNFSISTTTQNVSLLFNYTSGGTNFYSPVLRETIVLESFTFGNASNNTAPTIVAVTLTVTSNNQTLIASANATDPQGDLLTYFWRLFRNNTIILTGSNGTFPQGILRNFNNFSTNSIDGNYILEAIANDGSLNSSALNSSLVNVTFPRSSPPVMINATINITSDNSTLLFFANATDNDTTTLNFTTWLNQSGSISNLGVTTGIAQGITKNYRNYTVTSNGNYSIIVMANDGFNNSGNVTSNTIQVILADELMLIDLTPGTIFFILFIICLILSCIFFIKDSPLTILFTLYMIIYGLYILSTDPFASVSIAMNFVIGLLVAFMGVGLMMTIVIRRLST